MIEVMNLIGGKFVTTSEVFEDISPIDNTIIASVPRTKSADSAVIAAETAAVSWGNLSLIDRCKWLDRIADALEERIDEIAELESLDTGKPKKVALNVDARRSVNNFRFFANFGREMKDEIF